jgi:hypothetical protein
VEEGGSLHIFGEGAGLLVVKGNVQSDRADHIVIEVHGPPGVTSIKIHGNVQLEGTGGSAAIRDSWVGGNVQLEENGSIAVEGNTIGGNLQCERNGAFTVSDNSVAGNKASVLDSSDVT